MRRAPRFAIETPLRYRRVGQSEWLEGTIENISRRGVLFRAESLIDSDKPIEMSFVLPVEISDQAPAEVVCFGYIARRVPPSGPQNLPCLGTSVEDYIFVRKKPSES
jgi:hypothetical protein